MKVSKVIEILNDWFESDDEIMIDWVEQDDFFYIEDKPVDDEIWKKACEIADNSEWIFDNEMAQIIVEDVIREESV
tara:strand:+ start:358 stop:585 length:228 start_codon:yes stop_codon:yes gene_type:complete